MLGCGEWSILATARGGSGAIMEVPFSSLDYGLSINNTTGFRVDVSRSAGAVCCEVFDKLEPWRDELQFYRNGRYVHTGVLRKVVFPRGEDLTLDLMDLSVWFDKRWIEEDKVLTGNPTHIYDALFDIGMSQDDSPNITLQTRATEDLPITREFTGLQKTRCADGMRELSNSSRLDFITIGRTMYAGDLDHFFGSVPFIVHSEGVAEIGGEKDGEKFATDLAVIGNIRGRDQFPAEGRATRREEYWGLLQERVTDLTVFDNEVADQNAEARLAAMYPFPTPYDVEFSVDAQPEFEHLRPGVVADMKVARSYSCIEVNGEMLLSDVRVNVNGADESISGKFVPVGEFEE